MEKQVDASDYRPVREKETQYLPTCIFSFLKKIFSAQKITKTLKMLTCLNKRFFYSLSR